MRICDCGSWWARQEGEKGRVAGGRAAETEEQRGRNRRCGKATMARRGNEAIGEKEAWWRKRQDWGR